MGTILLFVALMAEPTVEVTCQCPIQHATVDEFWVVHAHEAIGDIPPPRYWPATRSEGEQR